MIVHWLIAPKAGICRSPSMADVTDIGGVIMPSANKAAPPIMAGITNHFFLRLTKAYNENIPPSPLLSAWRVNTTYLIVVCSVSVQIMQDNAPIMSSCEMTLPFVMAFNT